MSAVRGDIQEFIRNEPGIHFNGLRRGLSLATGQVQYHTRVLEREEQIVREELAGRTHFFLPTYGTWDRQTIALLRRETTREIIIYLLKHESAHPEAISERFSLARSTVEWHLSNLFENEIAVKRVNQDATGEHRVRVELTDPQTTYRLLREIEPGRTDRLVDRFIRITDNLLES